MSKKAKKKAAKKAEEERKMTEREEMDSLEKLLEEAKEAAVEIRGMRDTSVRDLQRIVADDVLGSVILIGEEFGERDEDHEVRLRRLEQALGLGDVSPEVYAAILDGEHQEPPVVPAGAPSGPGDVLESMYAQVPREVVAQAVTYFEKVCACVVSGVAPSEEDQQRAQELLSFIAMIKPQLGLDDLLEALAKQPEGQESDDASEEEEEEEDQDEEQENDGASEDTDDEEK